MPCPVDRRRRVGVFGLSHRSCTSAPRATRAELDLGGASRAIGGLAATALLTTLLGAFIFGKVLESPGATRQGVRCADAPGVDITVPGLSRGASAVASAQLRLALRTPRGRAILLSPLVLVFVYLRHQPAEHRRVPHPAGLNADTGLAIACFGTFVCGVSILPIALNQFAIDKGGLTRVLLSPLSDREYLAGKAVGNALIGALPSLFCLVAAYRRYCQEPGRRRRGQHCRWRLLSAYLLVAPAAAIFSAVFPRVVDLNSIGRGSNAHGLSGLLGMLTFVAAAAATAAIAGAATVLVPQCRRHPPDTHRLVRDVFRHRAPALCAHLPHFCPPARQSRDALEELSAVSIQLSAFSYQHSAISIQLSAFSYQHSAVSIQLSAFSYEYSAITSAISPVPSPSLS